MPKRKTIFALILFILVGHYSGICRNDLNFAELLPEKPGKANIISEKGYNVWGTHIPRGGDGKYRAIHSRWPKSRGHHEWVTHSEITHAVSDRPTGPYEFKNLTLPPGGKAYWDGNRTHNPHVIAYENRYYLYYMGKL